MARDGAIVHDHGGPVQHTPLPMPGTADAVLRARLYTTEGDDTSESARLARYRDVMAKPHRALVDLVAARDPAINALSRPLVESAVEHRVPGLLHTWADQRGLITGMWGDTLTALDANIWARNRMLTSLAERVRTTAEGIGVPAIFIKGVVLEALAYDRMGERPAGDLDIVVRSSEPASIARLVGALQPDHPWLGQLEALVAGGHIQSVDLAIDGIPIDIHLDPLKLEVAATRHPDRLWDRLTEVNIEGTALPTFDPEASLALALLHLNKDRFSHLIAYSDVVRLWALVDDWGWIESFARGESLLTPLRETAQTVIADLALSGREVPLPATSGGRLWRVLWPERIRLSGSVGRVRYRYRQMVIPMFGLGRITEIMASWLRRAFPSPQLLAIRYPDLRGSYLWRVLAGRVATRLTRRERRRAAMNRDQSPRGSSSEVNPTDRRA